jgi:multidrug efflux pump
MIGVTFFGIFMTPVFYVLIRKLVGNRPLVQHKASESTHAGELAGMPAE